MPGSEIALVLSGGGARGAYQVGFLRHLARRYPDFPVEILTGTSVTEKLGNVKSNSAGADDSHALADCSSAQQHVDIAQNHRIIDPGDIRCAWQDAAGEYDLIEFAGAQGHMIDP